jgi:uncharacterized membrane protein YphA (DoxX/SURF4 family)
MSILIAYIIIGLTFSVPFVATHTHVSGDSLLGYVFGFLVMTIIWPLAIWVSSRERYRKLFF